MHPAVRAKQNKVAQDGNLSVLGDVAPSLNFSGVPELAALLCAVPSGQHFCLRASNLQPPNDASLISTDVSNVWPVYPFGAAVAPISAMRALND